MTFTIIDAAIIFIYLMGMLVLGFIMGKTNKTQEDYFVAKRSLPWLLTGPVCPGCRSIAALPRCNGSLASRSWYHQQRASRLVWFIWADRCRW